MRFRRRFWLFLIAVLPTFAASAAEPDARFASGVAVRYENVVTDPAGIAYLRELDRELTRLFRLPGGARCEVLVRAGEGSAAVRRRSDGVTEIVLPASFAERRGDPALTGVLAARLTLARLGLPDRGSELPPWLAAGLNDELKVNRRAGRIVRNNRYFPLLRVLADLDRTPDFRALMKTSGPAFTGIEGDAFGELSRFLLEYLAGLSGERSAADPEPAEEGEPPFRGRRTAAVGDYAAACLTGRTEEEAYAALLKPLLESPEGARRLRLAMLRAAFHFRAPRPAASLLRRLPGTLVIGYHPLDAEGNLSETAVKAPAAELAVLLASGHPEAVAAQQALAAALRELAIGSSEEVEGDFRELIRTVDRMTGRDPAGERRQLAAAVTALERSARRRLALERRLLAAERELYPAAEWPPEGIGADDGALSAASAAFLAAEEEKFLAPARFSR